MERQAAALVWSQRPGPRGTAGKWEAGRSCLGWRCDG